VLCLTGTPILNRPVELVTQLQVLGRLGEIAPQPRSVRGGKLAEAQSFAFKFRYCGPEKNAYGWVFQGASNLQELNEKLRSSCFVRRERADVLDLHETHRTQISLTLNGALKAYEAAEADVIGFIRSELGNEAARKAQRAETLVKLNLLRRLAEEAKIAAAIEWVNDWLESYPEKKLVVFSGHVSVQKALAAEFACPTILGGEKDPEAQKKLFQEGDARVIVCSLQAAREGHTLTAASDVVFTSLGWTPGGLQQAEDRCNRIGQEADQVVAWQLHAEDTIDEVIGNLIEAKRKVFKAAVIGDADIEDDEEILDGVIDYLERRGQ
jgi:SWI/SNF-related matrix-associated actin-dependent regulator 1 of chromatin subfamily A